jgi:hypothetical protein
MAQHHSGHAYHDDSDWPHLELGPSDDRRYVEQLFKAIFQAGLSWPVVESHWPAFGEVFHGFDPVAVAAMTEEEIDRGKRAGDRPGAGRSRRGESGSTGWDHGSPGKGNPACRRGSAPSVPITTTRPGPTSSSGRTMIAATLNN